MWGTLAKILRSPTARRIIVTVTVMLLEATRRWAGKEHKRDRSR